MAPVKLTYFNVKGLGEPIRYILSYGGEEFIDHRVDFKNEWATLKPTVPFGKLPTLEIDGKLHIQSLSICRYLAKKHNLAGKDDYESMKIDATVDVVGDLRQAIGTYSYETDEAAKEKKRKTLFETQIPLYLSGLEKQVKENQGYFVNGKLTWADLYFVALIEYITGLLKTDVIEKYPSLQELKKKVQSLPAIKAWIAKRPVTEF